MQINPGGYLDNKGSFRDTPPIPGYGKSLAVMLPWRYLLTVQHGGDFGLVQFWLFLGDSYGPRPLSSGG